MKKLVLAMACVLGLGMLAASCKQGTQDVNLTNQKNSEKTVFVGKAEISATAKYVKPTTANGTTTYSIDTLEGTKYVATGLKFDASVKTDKERDAFDSNVEGSWTLVVPYNKLVTTGTGTAATTTTYYDNAITFKIYKIGDKYYYDEGNLSLVSSSGNSVKINKEKQLTLGDGESFDSDKFTVSGFGYVNAGTAESPAIGFELASVTFTRATAE